MTVEGWLNTELGIQIWNGKYKNGDETFDQWLDRISSGNEDVKRLIIEHKFLFGGRTLANRGLNNGSYSNCYSSGYVKDDLEDIMSVNSKLAMTYKAQGGQGVSLSLIRPKGTSIAGRYVSDGIVPIMEMFNKTTECITQGGSRKGALMISLDITHKEAETFITIKSDPEKINKANLSVEINDVFMQMVKMSYADKKDYTMDIERSYGSQVIKYTICPIKLYKLLMQKAWESAEPGVIYTNRFRNYNLMQFCDDYQIETSNPCGEQPLPKDGACNLGSINLSQYVIAPFTTIASFDFNEFKNDVAIAIKALDSLIDENLKNHAMDEQREMSKNYRNIGLGIMGLADTFAKLGIVYGSSQSIELTETIMKAMLRQSIITSSELAEEFGTFPKYTNELFDSEIINNILNDKEIEFYRMFGLRNCSLLSIAPTGTLGTMLNISTGIEPNFALSFKRRTISLGGKEEIHDVYCGVAQECIDILGTKSLPKYLVTSHDINWRDRINLQSAAQKYVDTAISSTINLPKEITVEEVEELYLYAWEKGLKGVTIFRDGSREAILTLGNEDTKKDDDFFTRPTELDADVIHFKNDSQQWVAFVGVKDGKPFEIFTGPVDMELFPIPKSVKTGKIIKVKEEGKETRYDFRYIDSYGYQNTLGGLSRCFNKEYWNYARLVSGMLRQQVSIHSVVEIVEGMHTDSETLHSWKNGVIRALKSFIPDGEKSTQKCPECGETLVYMNGCIQCNSCGWSKCS